MKKLSIIFVLLCSLSMIAAAFPIKKEKFIFQIPNEKDEVSLKNAIFSMKSQLKLSTSQINTICSDSSIEQDNMNAQLSCSAFSKYRLYYLVQCYYPNKLY